MLFGPLAILEMDASGWRGRGAFMTFASQLDRFIATLWFKGRSCGEAISEADTVAGRLCGRYVKASLEMNAVVRSEGR
jgi:hypothetical protein